MTGTGFTILLQDKGLYAKCCKREWKWGKRDEDDGIKVSGVWRGFENR